jgi:hypothetical protein
VLRSVAIALVVSTIAGVCYCTPLLDVLFFDEPFSSEKWITGDARTRGRMLRDLLNSGLLRGKTVAEIEKILGPGDVSHGDFIGPTPGYRVDIGYRWVTRPILYIFWINRPMSKFFDETTEVAIQAAGLPSDGPPLCSRRTRSLTICCT